VSIILLKYENKLSKKEVLNHIPPCKLEFIEGTRNSKSKLIKGDNLQVMKCLIDNYSLKGKINFVYIDPPFSTNNIFTYNEDKANTISRCNGDNIAYEDSLAGAEFIEYIRRRLILLKDLMSDNGSIYLHIDYKIGHYIKIIMDEIFGKNNFLNDITRIKCNPKNFDRKAYGNVKDLILFYSKKRDKHVWNDIRTPLTKEDINKRFSKIDDSGQRYTTIPLHAPGETENGITSKEWRGMPPPKGRHWRTNPKEFDKLDEEGLIEWSKTGNPRKKIYARDSKGKKIQDVLEYKDPQNPVYPTEKNYDLIKLFIKNSSNPQDIVLDCFCGSGTTLKAAKELGRNFIGIDNSDEAINQSLQKLSSKQKKLDDIEFEYLRCI